MNITLGGIELGEVNRTVCPDCGQTYYEIQLLSGIGIEQQICPDCEFRQTLTAAGISQMKQEEALRLIYEYIETERRRKAQEEALRLICEYIETERGRKARGRQD